MTDPDFIIVEDPPAPDLPDLMQRTEIEPLPAVSVRIEGIVLAQAQPARTSSTDIVYMSTKAVQALSPDLRRSRATLISTTAFLIADKLGGKYCPWPASVPLVVLHAGELWAKVGSSSEVELTVIAEYYAQ